VRRILAGLVIVIVGLLVLVPGSSLITVQKEVTERGKLLALTSVLVGDRFERSIRLEKGIIVNCNGTVTEAVSGKKSTIDLYLFSSENYQNWLRGREATPLLERRETPNLEFRIQIPNEDQYHLVFENSLSREKKYVDLELTYEKITYTRVSDERLSYVAFAVIGFGILMSAWGLITRPTIPWA